MLLEGEHALLLRSGSSYVTHTWQVFQIIYLGPAGAIPGYRTGNKGQQSVAKKFAIKKATIESIIRSAAIMSFLS